MSKLSSDVLRDFYFSGASNLKTFQQKKSANTRLSPTPGATSNVSASIQVAGDPEVSAVSDSQSILSSQQDNSCTTNAQAATTGTRQGPSVAQGGFASTTRVERKPNPPAPGSQPSVDAATPEYLEYLKLQQELQQCHQAILGSTREAETRRVAYQSEITHIRRRAREAIREIEVSTNWNLKSKYDVQQLLRDCALSMQVQELRDATTPPQLLELRQQAANLKKLMSKHNARIAYPTYEPSLLGVAKRFEAIDAEVMESNLDIAALSRIPDTVVIQVDHILSQPTCEDLLLQTENAMEHLLFKTDEERSKRDAAMEDGEMVVAEEHAMNAIEHQEELLTHILSKVGVLEGRLKENAVFKKVRDMYATRAVEDIQKIKVGHERTKSRCEADLRKTFALREKVEQVEATTAAKTLQEIKASEETLNKNAEELDLAWVRLEEAYRNVAALEHLRFTELKRRAEEKAKEEHRRMEYTQFIKVCEEHCARLELTIRNEDTALHCVELISQSVSSLLKPILSDLTHSEGIHKQLLLSAHQQHLEVFRALFLSVGEMLYRKQRRIDELETMIQSAHVQQELCADTFDPNARKYRDAKKRLLEQRDELEQQVTDLKQKAATALGNFKASEEYLQGHDVEFVHPVVEHEQQCLSFKAKMLNYKAMVMGHVEGTKVRNEIKNLSSDIARTREGVQGIVQKSAIGALDRSLPELMAATKSRPAPK